MNPVLSWITNIDGRPIVVKEALLRKGPWAAAVITTALTAVAVVAAVMFARAGGSDTAMAASAYQTIAAFLVVLLMVAAGVAAGTVSRERERRTFDLLVVSGLPASAIVRAKMQASTAHLALLMVTALPILLAVFLNAGLGTLQLVRVIAVLLATVVAVISLGVLLSALCPRTLTATMAAYGLVLAFWVNTVASGLVPPLGSLEVHSQRAPVAVVHPFAFANPWYAMHQVITTPERPSVPVGQMGRALIGGAQASTWGPRLQPWQLSVLLELVVSAFLLVIATRLVSVRPVRIAGEN